MRVVFDTNICALDGKADLIVIGDKKILDLREYIRSKDCKFEDIIVARVLYVNFIWVYKDGAKEIY